MSDGNGSNGNGAHGAEVPRVQRGQLIDITSYPTVMEVSRMAGVSHQAVRKWQRMGKLTPIEDAEGTTRYDPIEVEAFLAARQALRELGDTDIDQPKPDTLTSSLLLRPRQLIDDLFFKIIDRQDRQIAFLVATLEDRQKVHLSDADQKAERELVAKTIQQETEMKLGLAQKLSGAIPLLEKLVVGKPKGKGAGELSDEFLEQCSPDALRFMLCGDGIWSEAQQARIFRTLQKKQRGAESMAGAPPDVVQEQQGQQASATPPESPKTETAAPAAESEQK